MCSEAGMCAEPGVCSESGMCSEAGIGSEAGMGSEADNCSELGFLGGESPNICGLTMSEGIDMVLSGTGSSGRTAICLCPGVCWPTLTFSFMIVI